MVISEHKYCAILRLRKCTSPLEMMAVVLFGRIINNTIKVAAYCRTVKTLYLEHSKENRSVDHNLKK